VSCSHAHPIHKAGLPHLHQHALISILEFFPLPQQRVLTGVSREWRAAADSTTAGQAWRQVSRMGAAALDQFTSAVARLNAVRQVNDPRRRQQLLRNWQEELRGCLTAGEPLVQMLQSVVVARKSLAGGHENNHSGVVSQAGTALLVV